MSHSFRHRTGLGWRWSCQRRRDGLRAMCGRRLLFESLENRQVLNAGPLAISEFMAINGHTLHDGFGVYSDWIEIHNPTGQAVDLDGWYLTDDDGNLKLWEFPGVSLGPDERLVVFATGRNTTDPKGYLHTNFKLDGDGEYLALVQPDGTTVADEYAPEFPRQLSDVSYGVVEAASVSDSLIDLTTPLSALVPGDDNLDGAWQDPAFDDTSWTSGLGAIGYDHGAGSEFSALINFQPAGSAVPAGYVADTGAVFAARGNGFSYGWSQNVAVDTRDRNIHADQRYDTQTYLRTNTWEIAVPNGRYDLFAVFGDPSTKNQINNVEIEGTRWNDPDGPDNFDEFTVQVDVTDGRLTIRGASGASNAKICFIDIAGGPTFDSAIGTNLAVEMYGLHSSAYVRESFGVENPGIYNRLKLQVQYDDGFVAYLNGTKIAEQNAPASPVFDSTATSDRARGEALSFQTIDVTPHLHLLQAGRNVLAVHALNDSASSPDFLFGARLVASAQSASEQYLTTPTPATANVPGALGMVADTKFSVDRGFYETPFQLALSTSTAGAEIRYTLDGTAPTATTGSVYVGPITINKTTMVRVAAYKPGYLPTNVDTSTYLFLDNVIQQSATGLPDTWGYTGGNLKTPPGPDYAMDPAVVAANAPTIRNDLKSIPTLSLVTDMDYWFGTDTWPGTSDKEGIYIASNSVERPTSVELFNADGSEQFQVDASVEIQGAGYGGTSGERWKSYKLSLQLKFKESVVVGSRQFTADPKLRYPLFGDAGANEFDTLILDAQMNHTWLHPGADQQTTAKYIQDQYIADLQNAMGGAGPQGRFVHLYLNGLYWGIYDLHERPDEHFAAAYLGGAEEDYDVIIHSKDNPVVDARSKLDYQELLNRVNADLSVLANYERVLQLLDVDQFIDYMLINFYAGNHDWSHKNWYATFNRMDPNGRWRFHSWDAEHVLEGNDVTSTNNADTPTGIHQRLKTSPEYRIRFADRVQKHLFNGGVLTPARAAALYQARMTEIDRAIVGESARWGDNRRPGNAYTRANWLATQNGLLTGFFPGRTATVLTQMRNQTLYPSVAAPEFRVNGTPQHGGVVQVADDVTITAATGTIYYTLDGSDPRLPGGAINADYAILWSGTPIVTSSPKSVKARVLSGTTWSALSEAHFYVNPASVANVAITEINYHPHGPSEAELAADPALNAADFEFIELANRGTLPVDLYNVEFTEGIQLNLASSSASVIGGWGYAVVVSNPAAFALRYPGVPIVGTFTGRLDDAGERLRLADWQGNTLYDFRYGDSGVWPGRADGAGATLEMANPSLVPWTDPDRTTYLEDGRHWRSSSEYHGSPGYAGIGPIRSVVVNEVLTHTDLPQKDSIELYNPTPNSVEVGGWYLSDTSDKFEKYQIPLGTLLPAGGYLVFDEDDFNPNPLDPEPTNFQLNGAHGDDVWLMQADANGKVTHFIDHAEFGAARNGESLGRWPNGTGELYPMSRPTFEANAGQNAGPRVGPLVLSEVQYQPEGAGADDLEFVEIFNPTAATVDLTNWRLNGGIEFDFPGNTLLSSRSVLVVVPFGLNDSTKMAAFRQFYQIDASVALVGGYKGRLSNQGEKVRLERPDEPPADEPTYIPRVLEDEVDYLPSWHVSTSGNGDSLHRQSVESWGHDAASWAAGAPTPGAVSLVSTARVAGRHIFYNRSIFDGNDAAAGVSDDGAIATDKRALLPGQTATFANYTSYSRGINGVMVDVWDLKYPEQLTVEDFSFRMGNTEDPSTWGIASPPTTVTVRAGAGVEGSDRVTLIWPDSAIQQQWLQVTMLASEHTGLVASDVFYFGNAIGETGDSAANAEVTAADIAAIHSNPRTFLNPAPIGFAYDIDRDARVNAVDMLLARNLQTNAANALKLIHAPANKLASVKARASDAAMKQVTARRHVLAARWAWLTQWDVTGGKHLSAMKDRLRQEIVDRMMTFFGR